MADHPTPKPEMQAIAVQQSGTPVPLSPSQVEAEKRVAGLRRRIDMIADNDEKIVAGTHRAHDLPMAHEPEYAEVLKILEMSYMGAKAALAPWGMKTKRQLRIALYAQRPKKDVPYSIVAASERVAARLKAAGKAAGRTQINLNMVTIPAPKPLGENDRVIIVQKESK